MAWQIALLLDAITPVNVGTGLMPIWARSTEGRRAYPAEWRESWNSMWHPEPGFTLMDVPPGVDLVEWAAGLVPTIEEHHPNVFCLQIFGIDRSQRLESAMAQLEYTPATFMIEGGLSFTRPFELFAKDLILDAASWSTKSGWFWEQDFYTAFFAAVGAPEWHGRNFEALNDSIAGGGINSIEVPYRVVLRNVCNENEVVNGVVGDLTKLFGRLRAEGCPVSFTVLN